MSLVDDFRRLGALIVAGVETIEQSTWNSVMSDRMAEAKEKL